MSDVAPVAVVVVDHMLAAVACIVRFMRVLVARRRCHERRVARVSASQSLFIASCATQVQQCWRASVRRQCAREHSAARLQEKVDVCVAACAATLIQSAWRRLVCLRQFATRKQIALRSLAAARAVALVQRCGRGGVARAAAGYSYFAMVATRTPSSIGSSHRIPRSGDGSYMSSPSASRSASVAVVPLFLPVGYRRPTSEADFQRRLEQLHRRVRARCAKAICLWWRALHHRRQALVYSQTLNRLVFLNARAVLLQRWWRWWLHNQLRNPSRRAPLSPFRRQGTMSASTIAARSIVVPHGGPSAAAAFAVAVATPKLMKQHHQHQLMQQSREAMRRRPLPRLCDAERSAQHLVLREARLAARRVQHADLRALWLQQNAPYRALEAGLALQEHEQQLQRQQQQEEEEVRASQEAAARHREALLSKQPSFWAPSSQSAKRPSLGGLPSFSFEVAHSFEAGTKDPTAEDRSMLFLSSSQRPQQRPSVSQRGGRTNPPAAVTAATPQPTLHASTASGSLRRPGTIPERRTLPPLSQTQRKQPQVGAPVMGAGRALFLPSASRARSTYTERQEPERCVVGRYALNDSRVNKGASKQGWNGTQHVGTPFWYAEPKDASAFRMRSMQ